MHRFERITVALSATAADRPLLAYARMLASLGLGREYHFVHVRTPARKADEMEPDGTVLTRCRDSVHECFGLAKETLSHECHVIEGIRVDTLIEFISRHRSDLVLVGHRRSRSGQRSLARRLAMVAPCSVWLVPEGAPASINRILIPIDFSDNAADSVAVATSIANAAGLRECTAAHVFSDPSMVRYDEQVDEIRNREQAAFESFMMPIDRHGVVVEPVFVEGNDIGRTLRHTAQRFAADLFVMSTRGRSRAAAILLGSVTSQVMVESPIAVLAVKHSGAMLGLFQALQACSWNQPNPRTN